MSEYLTPLAAVKKSGQSLAVVMKYAVTIDDKPMVPSAIVESLKFDSLRADTLALAPQPEPDPEPDKLPLAANASRRILYLAHSTVMVEGNS